MFQKNKSFKAILALSIILLISIIINSVYSQSVGFPNTMYTKAERTNYLETSLHSDVMTFLGVLDEKTELAYLEIIGTSIGGRDIPLVIMADPPVSTPEEAVASGKLVLYIQANIHAGEVEGKETILEIMREIAFGPKHRLLENQILLFCPIYNTDGNDALSPNNRYNQDGSPIEAGERNSGEGYDLNRDGLKIDAIETKAMMQNVMNKWDPSIFVDMHTTNGVWHGYSITYAAGMHTAGHPGTFNYLMNELFPAITDKVKERSGFDTFLYGGFNTYPPQVYDFGTNLYLPRFLWNSMALKNKLGILVETFAHDKFEKRILSNKAFLTSLFEYTSENYEEIGDLIENINNEVVVEINSSGGQIQRGVEFETTDWGNPSDLLIYKMSGNTRTNKRIWFPNVRMKQTHVPTKLATVPKAYVFPAELTNVADKLVEHGIDVDTLSVNTSFIGEEFTITDFSQDNNSYQKHFRTHIQGDFQNKSKEMPAGSFYVDMAQPYAYCIFYMLEPASDDGLRLWNFFDNYLIGHGVIFASVPFPVFKVFEGELAGISESETENNFIIYPNPANDNIQVKIHNPESQPVSIEIIDSAAKILLKEIIQPGQVFNNIDISIFPVGNYFVRVNSKNSSDIQQLIIR